MKLADFDYVLPDALIARHPLPTRTDSRLLHCRRQTNAFEHRTFKDLFELVGPNDCLVLNNTRVFNARLHGKKASGGKIEILIERVLDSHHALAHIKSSHAPKTGSLVQFTDQVEAKVIGRQDDLFELHFLCETPLFDFLAQNGQVPLPPYIDRLPDEKDAERYQTVYARHQGAVAAPTAGLHFDQALLQRLKKKGVQIVEITLHVGAGTFQPVRVDDILSHKMHGEIMQVPKVVCDAVMETRKKGGRVIAVGTTCVRALESAASVGKITPYEGETDLFITPGYRFRCVDALITNFHLPKSTLLMLVCALGGYKMMMQAYQTAIDNQYRFYSYGDAMLVSE